MAIFHEIRLPSHLEKSLSVNVQIEDSVKGTDVPLLSVVVIGLNEEERIGGALQAVIENKPHNYRMEVLYVDSGSSDRSVDVAKGVKGVKVLHLAGKRRSAALARNVGLRHAQGQYVQLVDGDSLIQPGWMDAALAKFNEHNNIACVFGHCVELCPEQSIYTRICGYDWHVSPGDYRLCGGNALWRRDVLENYGYFDESLRFGEEPELCYRVRGGGWRIVCIDNPMVLHDLGMQKFGQYWLRAENTGKAYARVAARFWRNAERLWLREVVVNFAEPLIWVGGVVAGSVMFPYWGGVISLLSWWMLRTTQIAIKMKRRKLSIRDALLYSIHSQFMRLPVAIGQAKALLHRE